jgi:hypothetical protein
MGLLLLALAPYAFVALSLVLSIGLFASLKVEIRRLRNMVETMEQQPSEETRPAQPQSRPALNLSRRGQVLRLARRGERAEQISAAVGIPSNEVQLMLKLHQASLSA